MLRLCFYGCLVMAASVSAIDLSAYAADDDQLSELAEIDCSACTDCEACYTNDEMALAQAMADGDEKKKAAKKPAADKKCDKIKKDTKALRTKNQQLAKTVKEEKRKNKKKSKKLCSYKK